MLNLCSPGLPRGATSTLLPSLLEALGALPAPRGPLRPDRRLLVHFRRDGRQLLLHALAVAHPGGHLRGVPAAAQGEEPGESGLEPGPELELELEAPGVRVHAVPEQQG